MEDYLRREMNQKTIRYPVSIQGVGLHTGDTCTVKLSPSLPNTGITFYMNSERKRIFYADARKIVNPVLSTNIGDKIDSISTIEHLMACLHVLCIDNLKITVVGKEIPILDGSAIPFWNIIKAAEIVDQNIERHFTVITDTYEYSNGNQHIYVEPYDGLEIHMKVDFDHPAIGTQTTEFSLYEGVGWWWDWQGDFEKAYAPARTFGFLDQIEKAREQGLIKGGGLENAIVLDNEKIINPPLRFEDEFVTHKLVDFIGDIYINGPILGFFDVCCTSHQFNTQAILSIVQELN